MSRIITAIVEQGRLRPTEPLALEEGAEVRLIIVPVAPGPQGPRLSPQAVAARMAEIAAMPMEPGGEVFSNRDHDKILYGEKGAR